jgi:hypothetical protein
MIEDVSLDKHTILATLQCQCVTAIGIHENELDILFLIEIAVFVNELIIIVIQMLTQFGACLMRLSLEVI